MSSIDEQAIRTLDSKHDLVVELDDFENRAEDLMAKQEVLVFRSGVEISAEILDMAPDLGLVVRAGSGYDNIDLEHAQRMGIRVVRIPEPSADAVAEFTLGLIIAVSRNIVQADALLRTGHWPKRELGGHLIRGKVLGIVGAGNIGSRVGELGSAVGMRVIGCAEPRITDWTPPPSIQAADLDTVIASADFLTIHTPLTEDTVSLIGRRELGRMKTGSYLFSTARGTVVDEEALYEALVSGHLAGAALDVHEREGDGVIPELANLPNVVLTPHIAGMAFESQGAIGRRVVELIDAFDGGFLDDTVSERELLV